MKQHPFSTCIAALLISCGCISSTFAKEKATQAASANDFLNTIGVCVHIQHGQDATRLAPLLRYTGVRNVRDAADKNYNTSGLIRLHTDAGVKVVLSAGSGATDPDLPATIQMAHELHDAGALLAVEGPNEPNNFGGVTYQGVKSGKTDGTWMPVAKFQRDLYKAVKEDPVLKKYPVFSASEMGAQTDNVGLQFLTIPAGAGTLMPDGTQYADYANVHNYMYHPGWPGMHDNQVWQAADPTSACRIDGLYGNHGLTWQNKFKGYAEEELITLPKVTTETGVRVGDCDGGVTEEVQANHYMNVYLAQFKRGWSYTFIYEFLDDPDGAFGFYKSDYKTARKSAHYLHNLTTILSDNKSFKPKSLAYKIDNQTETVHDLLLQKSNGNFMLVVWGEKLKGSDNVTVQLDSKKKEIRIYDPTIGVLPIQTLKNTDRINLEISDHPLIIEIEK